MGTFMETSKNLVVKAINGSDTLELNNAITLSFYISERAQDTVLTSIDYKVDKIAGRTKTEITAWTAISLVGIENDVYTFDYTLTGVTVDEKVSFVFKVIDVDGLETFMTLNDFTTAA